MAQVLHAGGGISLSGGGGGSADVRPYHGPLADPVLGAAFSAGKVLAVQVIQTVKRILLLCFRFCGRLSMATGPVKAHLLLVKVGARQARKFTIEGLPCHRRVTQVEKGFP